MCVTVLLYSVAKTVENYTTRMYGWRIQSKPILHMPRSISVCR